MVLKRERCPGQRGEDKKQRKGWQRQGGHRDMG